MNYIDPTWPPLAPAKPDEPETKKINSFHWTLVSTPFSPAVGARLLQIIHVPK
jgi:hypothetical protein